MRRDPDVLSDLLCKRTQFSTKFELGQARVSYKGGLFDLKEFQPWGQQWCCLVKIDASQAFRRLQQLTSGHICNLPCTHCCKNLPVYPHTHARTHIHKHTKQLGITEKYNPSVSTAYRIKLRCTVSDLLRIWLKMLTLVITCTRASEENKQETLFCYLSTKLWSFR